MDSDRFDWVVNGLDYSHLTKWEKDFVTSIIGCYCIRWDSVLFLFLYMEIHKIGEIKMIRKVLIEFPPEIEIPTQFVPKLFYLIVRDVCKPYEKSHPDKTVCILGVEYTDSFLNIQVGERK